MLSVGMASNAAERVLTLSVGRWRLFKAGLVRETEVGLRLR